MQITLISRLLGRRSLSMGSSPGSTDDSDLFYLRDSSMILLGKYYRPACSNGGSFTIPAGKIALTLLPYFIASGKKSFVAAINLVASGDGSAAAAAIAPQAFATGIAVDNSTAGNLGGTVLIQIDLTTSSAPAYLLVPVSIYLQSSTDNTAWPDPGFGSLLGNAPILCKPGVVTTREIEI